MRYSKEGQVEEIVRRGRQDPLVASRERGRPMSGWDVPERAGGDRCEGEVGSLMALGKKDGLLRFEQRSKRVRGERLTRRERRVTKGGERLSTRKLGAS